MSRLIRHSIAWVIRLIGKLVMVAGVGLLIFMLFYDPLWWLKTIGELVIVVVVFYLGAWLLAWLDR